MVTDKKFLSFAFLYSIELQILINLFIFGVFLSDYWMVLKEIQDFCRNSSSILGSRALRYIKGDSESFGGNFSIQKRFSYFDHGDEGIEIPCGFFRGFPIRRSG